MSDERSRTIELTYAAFMEAVASIAANKGYLKNPEGGDFWWELYQDGHSPIDALDEYESYFT